MVALVHAPAHAKGAAAGRGIDGGMDAAFVDSPPSASPCRVMATVSPCVSRTQPSPLCFASRTSSFAPSHPPRRPRPRGCRVIYALYCRRCVRRAASWHRGSDSVSPPSLRHTPIPPREPPISKSGLIGPEFENPMVHVVFKIERAKCQAGVSCQASMTKGSFRHGFEFSTRWCRPSY